MSKEEENFWKNRKKYLETRDQYSDLTMGKIQKQIKLKEFREYEKLVGVGQQTEFECDVCGSQGKGYTFYDHHFENCKFNKVKLEDLLDDLRSLPKKMVLEKWDREGLKDFTLKDYNSLISKYNIPRNRKYTCPHCKLSGSNTFIPHHFDNCVMQGIDRDELVSFYRNVKSYRIRFKETSNHFSIPIPFLKKFVKENKIPIPKQTFRESKKLTGFDKGKEYTCPHCDHTGIGPQFGKLHFDNCWVKKLTRKKFEKFKVDVDMFSSGDLSKMYGMSPHDVSEYRKNHNIEWDIKKERKCPYCNCKSSGASFYGSHFGKCEVKTRKIDINELVKDLKSISVPKCSKKYGLVPSYLRRIQKSN